MLTVPDESEYPIGLTQAKGCPLGSYVRLPGEEDDLVGSSFAAI